jgi:hypothetical protein
MNKSNVWTRLLIAAGILCMAIGAVDPLDGSFLVLLGIALATLGSLMGSSRYFQHLAWSFALVASGVAAMVFFSSLGGIGGNSGNPLWWGIYVVPYPIGWFVGLVSGGFALVESWKHCGVGKASGT